MIGALRGAAGAVMRSSIGRGAAYGALAGGGWGMVSSDTSVLGGAMMGAGLGVAGARYGMPAARYYGAFRKGGFGVRRSMGRAARLTGSLVGADFRGAVMSANRGYSRVRSSMRGWAGGMGAGI